MRQSKKPFRITYLVQWQDRYGVSRTEKFETLADAMHMAEVYQEVYADLRIFENCAIHVRSVTEYAVLPL